MSKLSLFATCSQGLEPYLAEELKELGFQDIQEGFRGVTVHADDFKAIYKINYCSRIAGRILLPLARFRCLNRDGLYQGVDSVNWTRYIPKNKSFAIDANVTHPQLRNSLFAAQVAKDAICDQFRHKTGNRPSVDPRNPDVQLNLFIHNEKAIISLDTSKIPLYKRGYRLETVEAPLQESLAAAILKIAKWGQNEGEILLDPCAGSGTILIEAALIATKTPPGFLRTSWGFQTMPEYDAEEWLKVKNEADKDRLDLAKGRIYGIDINKNAVRIASSNLKAAGFKHAIDVVAADFKEFEPNPLPNLVVTNPPYGIRMNEEESLKPLYRALGDFLKRKTAKPGRGFIFTGSLPLSKEIGLSAKKRIVLSNSGIESRLLEYDLY